MRRKWTKWWRTTCPDNTEDARGVTTGRCLVPEDDSDPHLADSNLNLPSVGSGNGSLEKFKNLSRADGGLPLTARIVTALLICRKSLCNLHEDLREGVETRTWWDSCTSPSLFYSLIIVKNYSSCGKLYICIWSRKDICEICKNIFIITFCLAIIFKIKSSKKKKKPIW